MRWLVTGSLAIALVVSIGAAATAQDDEKRGSLEVTAQTEGAMVFLEGFLVGQAPVKVTGLPPGDYRVVVKNPGQDDIIGDVAVSKGEAVSFAASGEATRAGWSSPLRAQDDWAAITEDDQKRLEKAKAAKSLGAYQRLDIANFLTKSEEAVAPEHLFAILGSLTKALEDRKQLRDLELATDYSKGKADRWVSAPSSDKPTLVLSGVITKYIPGSRAQRYLVGFRAGKTRIYCLFRLLDKATGEVLFERTENGSVSGGLFGGSGSGATKELGEDIAKAIERER